MSQMEEPDYDESGEENDEQEDEFEQMLGMNAKRDIWKDNLSQKNEVVRELIKCFASMVEFRVKEFSIADHKGKYRTEDKVYEKLLDAPKFVTRAKRALISNENFDTRNFSIFIAHKGWIKHILRPLLELCAKDDCILAMRCCSLALVLIRRISDSSQKIITDHTKGAKRKASSLDLQLNEDDREDDEKVSGASGPDGAAGGPDKKSGAGGNNSADAEARKEAKEKEAQQLRIENVKQQLSALLSFKEALCSDKCNEAISNAFKEFWLKEQIASTEDNKTGVAICFSYLRRILAIDSHPQWSSIGEIQLHRAVHDRYIVQLRLLLSVIPGVCSDLLDAYHNDWLGDIILIIYFTLRGFEPKDLHRVWRTGALIENFDNIDTYELLENTNTTTATGGGAHGSAASKPLADVVIPTALIASAKQSTTVNGKGRLSQLLQKEKNNSLVGGKGNAALTGSRFKGTYQKSVVSTALPTVSTGTSNTSVSSGSAARNSALDAILGPATATTDTAVDTEASASTTNVHMQVSKIVKDPFNLHQAVVPAVQAKRNRKNLTFNMEDSRAEATSAHYSTSSDHQKAAVVAATLVNLLSSELSLKPLVKRVNDDLRRDDMRVGQELELRYFDILYRVLHYNRLKLADEYRDFLQASDRNLNLGTSVSLKDNFESAKVKPTWQPNLKNVMDALDRMSFMRVVTAIERLGKNPLHNDDIVIPLALFKEMICYLRVLLESELTGHHEIAVAALYRLYYASSERLDPLPRLLSAWKSGTYPKRHLNVLVELVHETLKTLETAQVKFRTSHEEDSRNNHKKQRKLNKKEMDMEQYEMACVRFVTDEYFKRYIATNHSVRMYTKLLSHYTSNDVAVNYYVYSFLKRLNAFALEQEHRAPMPPTTGTTLSTTTTEYTSTQNTTATDPDQVSLGFLLYNIHTLEVFSTIVNDRDVYTNSSLEPLVRLIKAILRRFFAAATKNRMLFVEVLFVHPRPHDFCVSIDSVYEASAYATYSHGTSTKANKLAKSTVEDAATSDSSSESDDTEYGDEFDENNLTSAFAADPTVAKVGKKGKEKKEKKVREGKKKRNKRASSGDGLEDTDNSDAEEGVRKSRPVRDKRDTSNSEDGSDRETTTRATKPVTHKPPAQQSRLSQRASSRAWSLEEDEVLREQFKLYAGSHSVFSSIAHCPELRALGNNRNEAQVQKRVTQLQLHLSVAYSDSEHSDNSGGNIKGSKEGKKREAAVHKRQGKKQRKGEEEGVGDGEQDTQEQRVSQGLTQSSRPSNHHPHEDTIMFSDHDDNDSINSGSGYESEGVLNISGSPTQLDEGMNSDNEGSQTQPQLLSPDMRNDLAGLFSPLPSSGGKNGGSSNKRARLNGKDDKSAPNTTTATTSNNPFWELQDGELDVFEQRSLALMKSTGGASYGLSDDEDSLFGASSNNKKKTAKLTKTTKSKAPTTTATTTTATAASGGQVKKGLTKTATVADSDDESLVFESSAATTAGGSGALNKVGDGASTTEVNSAADAKTLNKRRLMRIDDEEED